MKNNQKSNQKNHQGTDNILEAMPGIQKLIEMALMEDVGSGDITTDNLVSPDKTGKGIIVAKEPLVIAGIDIAHQVFARLDGDISFIPSASDGDFLNSGDIAVEIEGRLCSLLKGERTALNFLQRLSGVATHVKSFVDLLENKNVRLVDTRKTTPGWRVLEKYAVRIGGAFNHRSGLFDGVLIKDNHIKACGGIKKAVTKIRKNVSHLVKIEVEVTDLDEVKEALEAESDVIMLDNMDLKEIREAVKLINGKAVVEVSGMVTQKELNALAETGVDIISAGALTHSAKAVDLSMRVL
jgi:nicotinate-nucleotide pyrophosphorylase (carboxylating)